MAKIDMSGMTIQELYQYLLEQTRPSASQPLTTETASPDHRMMDIATEEYRMAGRRTPVFATEAWVESKLAQQSKAKKLKLTAKQRQAKARKEAIREVPAKWRTDDILDETRPQSTDEFYDDYSWYPVEKMLKSNMVAYRCVIEGLEVWLPKSQVIYNKHKKLMAIPDGIAIQGGLEP